MDTTKLITIVSILITLGMASERLVEIIKGFFPTLNEAQTEEKAEAWRKAKISMLSVGCGILTAFLASSLVADISKDLFKGLNYGLVIFALGLLASAGSAFWNSILEYLLKIKDLKKAEIAHTKAMQETETVKARALKMEAESMLARERPKTE